MGIYDEIDARLQGSIDNIFEHGWQPADLAHFVRRECSQRHVRLTLGLIARHSRQHDAVTRAPHEWLAQLDELGVYSPADGTIVGGHGVVVERWARTEKLDPDEATSMGSFLNVLLTLSRVLPLLGAPPSKWGNSNRGVAPVKAVGDDVPAKTLHTIRALLAKAESTDFEAEAEAFTAKAQELMARHSIDTAMLAASAAGAGSHAGVAQRRVHIDNPYADEKALFLGMIARVNGARSVWSAQPGFCTVMGFPVDVQLTEMLFTSLLVQATHASAVATAHDKYLRTASFRRAFLVSFADRIAERLRAATSTVRTEATEQYGSALAPVLAAKEMAVERAVEAAFPNTVAMKAKRYSAEGWHAGRAAADRADIGAGAALTEG
ncbi:MAG: DUF2786 domain-containing protein [Actinobacteria bacterium]|nr:DUF2786 domain-containing protein [Actinomycetota bacterium]